MKRILFITVLMFIFCLALYGQTNEFVCPQISLITPEILILPNSPVLFAVKITENMRNQKLLYNWNFSSGRILEGQGSSKVKFIVEDQENTNIRVSVKITGLPEKCSSVFEDTIGVVPPIIGDPLDQFGKIDLNDLKPKLDNLIIGIRNYLDSTGLIQMTFDKNDSRGYKIARFKNMLRFFESRRLDLNRMIIAYSTGDRENSIFWICPPGAKLPTAGDSSYQIIEGRNLRKEINRLSSNHKRL